MPRRNGNAWEQCARPRCIWLAICLLEHACCCVSCIPLLFPIAKQCLPGLPSVGACSHSTLLTTPRKQVLWYCLMRPFCQSSTPARAASTCCCCCCCHLCTHHLKPQPSTVNTWATAADDGGDASLPSVLADNPSIAEQWRSFLLVTLFEAIAGSGSGSGSGSSIPGGSSSSSSSGLSLESAAAAACYLLLQDRVDDAEQVLAGVDLDGAAAALKEHDPLRMQVSTAWWLWWQLHRAGNALP